MALNIRVLKEESAFALSLLVISFYYVYLRWSLTGELAESSLQLLTEFNAWKPFQFRVLVPFAVHHYIRLSLPFSDAHLIDIYRVVETAFAFLLLVSFRYYSYLVTKSRLLSFVAVLLLFFALAFNYVLPFGDMAIDAPDTLPSLVSQGRYALYNPYDTPSVFFFTIGLLLLYRGRLKGFYILFIIATFNRETSCFLTFVYLFTSISRDNYTKVLGHCAAQFVVWAGIKATLSYVFQNNEGGVIEWPFAHNLWLAVTPVDYPHLLSSIGYLWLPALLFYRKIKDHFVRRALMVVVPYALGMLFVGIYDELRIWGELIPVIVPAVVLIIKEHVLAHQAE